MRTITKNIYTFDELSDEAKERAIENYRALGIPFAWHDEAIASIKAIADVLNCSYSWYSYDGVDYTVYLEPEDNWRYDDTDITELEGRRAWAYIENNFISKAERPKTYYLNHVIYCDGRKNWSRKSKINYTINDCPFTGYCMDCCFSEAWRDWKKTFNKYSTVGDFIELVAEKLGEDWTADNEYQNSDEGIIEIFECNDYEFTEDGDIY